MIKNPILRGFHPDPSIVRVESDYYIATSTFEWWPGVKISHSTDLANWNTLGYVLNDPAKLDLRGIGSSQGIWAPCLTYNNGMFYLVYTVVSAFYCNMYDTKNYLVTAQNIMGPWSAPVSLNNFGFDPSMFHDDDGRKYIVSMVTDHRVPKKYAGRIVLQEYSDIEKKVIGPVKEIYTGEKIFLEGPHIYKRNGYYYLFSADTGTGELHGQTIQRSKSIWGPYEMYKSPYMNRTSEDEAYSIMTTRHDPDFPLQKCGHGDIVETPAGDTYMVHLCGRPLDCRNSSDAPRFPNHRRYFLGRETAIQKMRWTEDEWLVLDNGTTLPDLCLDFPAETTSSTSLNYYDDFDETILDIDWLSLRIPMDEDHASLKARPGFLRLYGRDGLASKFNQTLIARRCTEFTFEARTKIEFHPTIFKQMAGLILIYDIDNYLYLHISYDEELGSVISLLKAENKVYSYPFSFIPLDTTGPIVLSLKVDKGKSTFFYKKNGDRDFSQLGAEIDCSFLSDEACLEGWFTGSMVGLCCQDLTGFGLHADFDNFMYVVNPTF